MKAPEGPAPDPPKAPWEELLRPWEELLRWQRERRERESERAQAVGAALCREPGSALVRFIRCLDLMIEEHAGTYWDYAKYAEILAREALRERPDDERFGIALHRAVARLRTIAPVKANSLQENRQELLAFLPSRHAEPEHVEPALPSGEDDPLVTLEQASSLAKIPKRTAQRLRLPDPDRRGGRGKPHLWRWSRLRLALEPHAKVANLPMRFPSIR